MKALLILLAGMLSLEGASWYVSDVSVGAGNGTTWANAKAANSSDNFGLAISAGDTINVDGGSTSKSYSGVWTFTANGTAGSRITIQRSVESGHDGAVNLPGKIKVWGRYYTVDGNTGGAWPFSTRKCTMGVGGTGGTPAFMIGYWENDASGTIVKRIAFVGQDYTNPNFNVVSVGIYSPGCTVRENYFYEAGGEDMFGFYGLGGNGSFFEKNVCDTLSLDDTGTQHRDAISLYGGPSNTQTATVRWNIFIGIRGDRIIQTGPRGVAYGRIVAYGNVSTGCNRLMDVSQQEGTTVQEVILAHETVFNSGPITTWSLTDALSSTVKNLILNDIDAYGGGAVNTAFQTGTTGANTMNGNAIGNVNFQNTASPLGVDLTPFTIDDGFRVLMDGIGIGNGTSFPPYSDLDILGLVRGASIDDGAYEFDGALPPPPTPPTAPSGLIVSGATTNSLNLAWTDNSSTESNFIISRSTDNVAFNDISTKAAGSTSHTDASLAASTTYYYKVRATNAGGDSSNSNTANGTTSQVVVPPPPAEAGDVGGVFFLRGRR